MFNKDEIKKNKQDISKDTISFSFLDDDPVDTDLFGSHQLLAKRITDEIESSSQGMTIGLEGTWGSGKSSIVKMMEDIWKENKEVCVFTFDTWVHQGDPLRRAFLESLVRNLQDNSSNAWLNRRPHNCSPDYDKCSICPDSKKEKCIPDEICEELRHRKEHNTIQSEPTLTRWGVVFAIATLAMPIGMALYSSAKDIGEWYYLVGGIIASSPLIVILMCLIIGLFKHDGLKNIVGQFIGKTKEITRQTTHRGTDPTSVEFQEYYWRLVQLALEKTERKLVIVLDNLDRVERHTALEIWATMRTFLHPGRQKDHKLAKGIWVLVPYDPDAIDSLWQSTDEGDNKCLKDDLSLPFKEKNCCQML